MVLMRDRQSDCMDIKRQLIKRRQRGKFFVRRFIYAQKKFYELYFTNIFLPLNDVFLQVMGRDIYTDKSLCYGNYDPV